MRKDPNIDEYRRADRLGLAATIITVVLALAVVVAAVCCIADLATIYNNY